MNKFISLVKLIYRTYFANFQGPFFLFFFPVLMLAVIGEIVRSSVPTSSGNVVWGVELITIVPGLMALGVVSLSLLSAPVNVVSLKESVIIKRIAVTPIRKQDFIFINIFSTIILSFLASMWLLMWSQIFYYQVMKDGFDFIDKYYGVHQTALGWFLLFVGIFLVTSVASSIGMYVASLFKTVQSAIGVLMLIYFPSLFFSGVLVPVGLINESYDWLRYISYFAILKYPTQTLIDAYFGQNIFNASSTNFFSNNVFGPGTVNHFTKFGVPDWFAVAVSAGLITTFYTATAFTWKWET